MSITVTIGNRTYEIPEPGEKVGWGEEATDYLVAIADALASVQGPNDILQTASALANNQTTLANIPGFSFDTSDVLSFKADYDIIRTFDSGTSTIQESGTLIGSYDGSTFTISQDGEGDSGVRFDITNTGNVQYTSTDLTDHVSSTINFKAKTIDQP